MSSSPASPDFTGPYSPQVQESSGSRAINEGPGTVIGPYKLLQQIGEGGFGVVYLAEQSQPVRRMVGLKIIKPGMDTGHVIARFEQERQALALMDHPNIAKVLDAGTTEGGRPYFVMELVKGIPITRYCDQEHLTPQARLELFVPICQAVQHAHQKGIIHRDLKPSNVLIALYDGKPIPKVIDFGVAKATAQKLTERTMFTEVGQIVGTMEYMAPEQAELNNLDIDTRADIYSLGVLLYELLTGSPPFTSKQLRGAAFPEMLRMIREVEPPKPSTKLSSSEELANIAAKRKLEPKRLTKLVHGDLDWIVMKCLEKERGRRYETANQLGLEVERFLANEPVQAGPPSARYRLRKFLRRNRGPVLAAALLALGLLTGAAVSAWQAVRAVRAQGRAEEEADRAREAEKVADEQRAITAAVNDFWRHDVLAQASPEADGRLELPPDKDIKVRTVLDRAAAKIAGRFPGQPLIEAAVRLEIGDAYFGLGEYDLALVHLQAAYELRRTNLGDDHAETLEALEHEMRPYVAKGQFAQLEPLVQKELESRRRTAGRNHPDTLKSETDLADLYPLIAQGNKVVAEKAEPLYQRVLEVRLQELGPNHPDTLMAQIKLGAYYTMLGRSADAESLLVKTLDIAQKNMDQDHPCVWEVQYHLANLYEFQGQHAKAEPLRLSLLEGRRRKFGKNQLTTLQYEAHLAQFYRQQRQYAKAEPLLKRVLDEYRERYGEDHPDTMDVQSRMAGLYTEQGQFAKAEPLLLPVLEVQRRKLGEDSPDTLRTKDALANLYLAAGQHEKAASVLERLVEARRRLHGEDDPRVISYQNKLATSYEALGQHAEAEPLWRELLAGQRRKTNTDPLVVAGTLANLGLCLLKQEKYAPAEPLLRESLAIREQKQPEGWTTFKTRSMLGGALLGLKTYPEVEPLLLAGYEGMKRSAAKAREAGAPDTALHMGLIEALERLVSLYDTWGKKDEAEKWRKALGDAKSLPKP